MKVISTIEIEMFPAKNGDCFLISCLGEKNTHILLDLGYPHTYRNYVRPKLISLKEDKESLDLVAFTHIDQDHIQGGITFFKENGDNHSPVIINVKEVWHNSYRHLNIGNSDLILNDKQSEQIKEITSYIESDTEQESTKVSGKQGTWLGGILYKQNYSWNSSFGGKAVSFSSKSINVGNDVKITVLSPTETELNNLKKIWIKELRKLFPEIPLTNDKIFDDAIEYCSKYLEPDGIPNKSEKSSYTENLTRLAAMPFVEDTDKINASSITFILEYGGKRLLFLGDSPPSLIENQLKEIFKENDFPVYFDLIKVSHHGSENNTSESLMKYIDSSRYLISTDGSGHGHPHTSAIARIVTRKSNGFKRKIFMSHRTPTSDFFNKDELKTKYNYEIHLPERVDQSSSIKI
ncbi:MBL fold metallo-hydrolase [Peribacillus sp. NPDC060186]